MPQINRVRVNNVKYNFGTQYYDDFMMRFNCSNTIYDLANGGGKSLLMLLLLQNVIPNCTLDEKQPIEKLFRSGCNNTTIHSLIEWKLDPCYQKDNFKFMTTGFCARKGRGNEDDTDAAGSAEQYSSSNAQAVQSQNNRDSASVEYFNYCIFYREFGDNDIRNLPLVSNGERITYNGLKSYLRDLEKNDFSVSVKIFDRKGDYQNFISQYGLFESQWEIVRGINKTEGHVRTYFETNYKTSRKVIEDLLIEEIIQKSYNNALSVSNDEGKMAETLLDIKDKLVELSKKHAQMNSFDSQMDAIHQFVDYVKTFEELYRRKQELEHALFDLYCASKIASLKEEKKLEHLTELKEKMHSELSNENRYIQTAEVLSEQKSLDSIEELIKGAQFNRNTKMKQIEEQKKKLSLMESANDFKDYKQYLKACAEVTETLNNNMRDHSDLLEEMKCIARVYKERNRGRMASIQDRIDPAEDNYKALKRKETDLNQSHREADQSAASAKSLLAMTEKQIKDLEQQSAKRMEEAGLIVAEKASEEYEQLKDQLAQQHKLYAQSKERLDSVEHDLEECRQKISERKIQIMMLNKEKQRFEQDRDELKQSDARVQELIKIYNVSQKSGLESAVLSTYRSIETQVLLIEQQITELEQFIQNAKNGTYICNSPLRNKLKKYLETQYGDDVVEGHEWYRNLNPGQKRDVAKRAPFIEYAFVIKNDFERIRMDKTLDNFERGAYAIPIVSEQILYDMKLEVNSEFVAFAMKNMDFLRDDSRLDSEIRLAGEELDALHANRDKWKDKIDIVWEDYQFVLRESASDTTTKVLERQKENEQQIDQLCKEEEILHPKADKLEILVAQLTKDSDAIMQTLEQGEKRAQILSTVIELNCQIQDKYQALAVYKQQISDASLTLDQTEQQLDELKDQILSIEKDLKSTQEELNECKNIWAAEYEHYYDSSFSAEEKMLQLIQQMDTDKLESRFMGLKGVLEKDTANLEDKETLRRHYQTSMDKCKHNIDYRGVSFDEVERLMNEGSLRACESDELLKVKDNLNQLEQSMKKMDDELEAQNALMNRLEGSIAHGMHQIEEKYGAFETFECENPDNFMKQHKQLVEKLKQNIKDMDVKLSQAQKASKDIFVMEKDLERIVKQAGLTVPEHITETDQVECEHNLSEYEDIHKEYETLLKLAYKKRDEFEKYKSKLIQKLNDLQAQELANEIRLSVQLPETEEQTQQMVSNLLETNTFIQLERDRITKGIEDMERIKDNFENRCIQTCSNIKTELDRLPNLSTITMDDEKISMIGLSIPYVNEKLYKDRMSSYIDETIMVAESFQDMQERLRYIRNRLAWKRLFSVIVTDMNAIGIHLYKRERIKDQSRYLKYEEAVGSTGQSQGIYIQFLIAIINYISSINASATDSELLGKTIFIDNPFGAAKDIYIWEPIFKLLKTNHVQLIVPARGATPAITGRFDVNYILGQKLVDKRQQTVVVDYYSKTKETQLEYVKMDYEQVAFDFLSN